ncbi:7,8-didemethyl-8-hydroxy-5-deazariboflavin synthase subunit CofG [Halegenticoccus tardaugens]|uniref:7,8-didemethyl-8-hydroxy-5-deazariboflavin synthase subunit CofG n=1 Tax=Halegenticoccus tardaugens TaxID=2071624 RepID=UPI00100B25A0|nr:7,8-didemethyl-8-hydroxy-5-deazariboflavin synthase subunit CofG [Halegenticoccus tardaugens]
MFPAAAEYDVEIEVDGREVERLLSVTPDDVDPASALSFSRNVFVPLTTACRYTCTYCAYYDVPGEATLMSPDAVRETLRLGADAGCTEALFTFGDEPDARYVEIHEQLAAWGHESILDYLFEVCEMALDEGLLPHSNPGDLTEPEFERLSEVNASMGVMLETTADVRAHSGTRRKTPGQRLNTIRAAGRAGVPFTTGILVGIGETWRDRAESLLAIRELHERHGHVQEVIVQNVVPNERSDFERPSVGTMRRVVAMARAALPEEVSVQVPPNLSPTRELLDCGVDDLGGVSPVTDDYINPDYAWPALRELEDVADEAGVPLYERLPVYGRYLRADFDGGARFDAVDGERTWLSERILRTLAADDEAGERYRAVLARRRPRDPA